jgi:hypothetical protein
MCAASVDAAAHLIVGYRTSDCPALATRSGVEYSIARLSGNCSDSYEDDVCTGGCVIITTMAASSAMPSTNRITNQTYGGQRSNTLTADNTTGSPVDYRLTFAPTACTLTERARVGPAC